MIKKWKLVTRERVFETNYLNIEKHSYELPNGKIIEDYYHVNRPNYVLIIFVINHVFISLVLRLGPKLKN